MNYKVNIGGKLFDKADAKISVYDHGLLYGDGVFEGIRSYSGRVFRLAEHVDRLTSQVFAGPRQCDRPPLPLQKSGLHFAFELGDLVGDGGLGDQ